MLMKVCGITLPEQMQQIDQENLADLVGMIFYPASPRFISSMKYTPKHAKLVGVFVNATLSDVLVKINQYRLDFVQLHGEEKPQLCEELRKVVKVIKAFSVKDRLDENLLSSYENFCDYFLFDTYSKQYGGTGKSFSWDLLRTYQLKVPFILSGGIGPESVQSILKLDHACFAGIDINSRFETQPGIKDLDLIRNFKKQLTHENTTFT